MRLFALMLAVFVSGCAESLSPDELEGEGPSLRTQQAALRQCSEGPWWDRCPSGQHIAWVTNDESCPSRYAYACEVDTSSFQACGLGCPYGYHSTRYDWTTSCYQRGGVEPNVTTCERNEWPRAFHMCGAGCPDGWHDEARDLDITCFTSTSSSNMTANATSCGANDGPAFTRCKTLWQSYCPGGYDKTAEYHDPSCDVFGASSPDTLNAVSCSRRPPKLSSVTLERDTVRGGAELTGRVLLDGKAEEMGATVTLTSNDSAAVPVHSTVTIPYRAYEVSFPIRTSVVPAQRTAKITAMFDGRTEEWPLTLLPLPTVSSVAVETFPSDTPPATIQGAVFLDGEAQGSTEVTLSSSNRDAASVPDSVIVPDGKRGASFTVTLSPVDVDTPVTLTASIDEVKQSTTLTVPVPPAIPPGPLGQAIFQDAGCNAHSLPATDNGSTGPVALPFPINFHGAVYNHAFINNNGNVTFEAPHDWTFAWDVALGGYFEPAESTIAAFYADVDTRGAGSNVVHYGEVNFGGHPAFCVNWLDVGYFNGHSDKLNSFQLLLVQRNDVGLNDFDIYLNYGSVQWDCVDNNIYCEWGGTTVTAGYWAVPVHGSTGFLYSYRIPGAWTRGTWLDNSGSPYSLIHSAHNSPLPGQYIFPIRNGDPATLGTLAGRVTDTASTPMAKALVEVCPVEPGLLCTTVTTDGAQGTYSVEWLPEGDYTITAFPSSRSNALPQTVGPVHVTTGATLTRDITLPPAMLMPPEVSLSPATTGDNGVSIVNYNDPLALSVPGCAGGTATYSVQGDPTVFASGPMREAPTGMYSALILPLSPNKGLARVSVNIACTSIAPQSVVFDIYIDPSNTVRTLQGRPVRDALVTLYRADKPEGPFTVVPSGSALMSPLNRTNPDVTDTQGRFRWDVIAGYYKVRAERAGCLSLSGAPYAESEVLPVPPVTDLDLRLDCPGLDDLTSPSSSASVSPPANAHGWNNTEVQVQLTATDDDSGVEALVCTLSGAQPGGIIMHGPGAEALIATEGETTVSWFAYDVAGNPEESHSLQVRIDQTPPSSGASVSSSANATGWYTGPVTVELSASDLGSGVEEIVYTLSGAQSGTATVSGDSASVPVSAQGTTTLTWHSRDLAGNEEPAHSLQIRIEMRTPTLSCEASPAELWPPNHKLIPVQVHAWFDNASPGLAGTVRLVSVTSNEPDSGLGTGDRPGDIQGWEPGTGDTAGVLRAERSAQGSGRTYTLTYQGSDQAGNVATCVTTVTVSHDQRR